MRRLLALFLSSGLVAACSVGGDTSSQPSVAANAAADSTLVEETLVEEAGQPSDRSGENLTSGAAVVETAVAEYGEGSAEVNLARWAALSGPLPSLPDALRADLIPSLTEVLKNYPGVREQLDPSDAAVIDERVEELLDAEFAFDLDVDGLELDAVLDDTSGDSDGAEGFRGSGLVRQSPADDLDDDDFVDSNREDWVSAARQAATLLGSRLPDVSSLRVKVVVSQPSFWLKITDSPERAARLGGGLILAASDDFVVDELRARYDPGARADCFLIVTADDQAPVRSAAATAVLTHELFHCWHFNRVGQSLSAFEAAQNWISEGLASWVGETLAGGTYYTAGWVARYVRNPFPMFASAYAAYGFWGRINESTSLWHEIPGLIDTSATSSAAVYDQALATIPSASAYIAAGALQNSSLGREWSTEGWMPSTFTRTPAEGTAGVGDPAERSAGAGVQRADRIAVTASEGDVLTIDAAGYAAVVDLSGEIDLAAFGEALHLDICIISCVCPTTGAPMSSDFTVGAENPTLFAALAGKSASASTLVVGVLDSERRMEVQCEESSESDSIPADNLLGTWRANPESIEVMFEEASAFGDDAIPLDVSGVGGDLLMSFLPGGDGELVYDRVTLSVGGEFAQEIRFSGSGSFQWDGDSAGGIQITETEFSISVSSSAVGDNFLTLSSDDVPASGTTTLGVFPDDNQLTITAIEGSAGEVFFPTVWTRQG